MSKKKLKLISILLVIVIIIGGGVYVADLFLGYEAPEIKKLSDSNLENIEDVDVFYDVVGLVSEDVIASVIAGSYMNGLSFYESVKKATSFASKEAAKITGLKKSEIYKQLLSK